VSIFKSKHSLGKVLRVYSSCEDKGIPGYKYLGKSHRDGKIGGMKEVCYSKFCLVYSFSPHNGVLTVIVKLPVQIFSSVMAYREYNNCEYRALVSELL